ncbi:MAG: hypothetical protein AB8B80_13875 [Marinicellaceae bacterium]
MSRLSRQDNEEILKSLDVLSNDKRTAEFYYHEVFDNEASTSNAKQKAIIEARNKTKLKNANKQPEDFIIIDPDFSGDNLKRLGAMPVYKKVLYVKIGHYGSKDYKSRIATEQDKADFSQQWNKFNEQEKRKDRPSNNQNIYQGQKEISFNADRQKHNQTGSGEIINFSYSFEL